jgi:hypothetical protein
LGAGWCRAMFVARSMLTAGRAGGPMAPARFMHAGGRRADAPRSKRQLNPTSHIGGAARTDASSLQLAPSGSAMVAAAQGMRQTKKPREDRPTYRADCRDAVYQQECEEPRETDGHGCAAPRMDGPERWNCDRSRRCYTEYAPRNGQDGIDGRSSCGASSTEPASSRPQRYD